VALNLTSFRGDLAAFCDHSGARSWPVRRHEEHVLDVFASEASNLVMLTPDAAAPLEGPLDPRAIYVIGGIIDKSVIKGLSLGWAEAAGVRAARLPVREHAAELGMSFDGANKTPVLSVSDVVAAMIEAGRTGGDWTAALAVALPERVRRAGVPGRRRR
jgi:tRNA (guanine9-N1)-methyltransferase